MPLRRVIRWSVVTAVTLHGLLHLVGAVQGLGIATVPSLADGYGPVQGVAWLVVGLLVLVVAVRLATRGCPWWLSLVAAAASELLIVSAWQDARAGTVVNVLLVAVAAYTWVRSGPRSLRAEYARRVGAALAEGRTPADLTDDALATLPAPVAAVVRVAGAADHRSVLGFRATIHGRIRAGATKPWMPFTGEQVNVYGAEPARYFLLDATMMGLPVDVLHVYEHGHATMRVRLCSVVPVADGAGPELDRAETVTLLNDLCLLVPEALVGAPIVWEPKGGRSCHATLSVGAETVSADLMLDGGRVVDFVSDDRLRASPDGRSFTSQRWSTPVWAVGRWQGRTVCSIGEARWHAPVPERTFSYLEFVVDDMVTIHGRPWVKSTAPSPRGEGAPSLG